MGLRGTNMVCGGYVWLGCNPVAASTPASLIVIRPEILRGV